MAFNFSKFNSTNSKFTNMDSTEFRRNPNNKNGEPYFSLREMVEEYGEDAMYKITGMYINTKGTLKDVPESPVVATESEYVNLPVFQLKEVKAIIADDEAVEAINAGKCGFFIETYTNEYGEQLKVVWCDYDPDEE